jgi:hypothetical protein
VAATYEVAAVDGSGNLSPKTEAHGTKATADTVLQDTSDQITHSGTGWTNQHPAWSVSGGSELMSRTPGDSLELKFQGNRVTWYGRLGAGMGQADVYIDGTLDRTADTYDADEIPNVPVYTRSFPSIAEHTIRIVVRGSHHWRSSDDWVVLSGWQIGKSPVSVVEGEAGIVYEGEGGSIPLAGERLRVENSVGQAPKAIRRSTHLKAKGLP